MTGVAEPDDGCAGVRTNPVGMDEHLANGVWSDSVSAPVDRRCETSQPSTTVG